MQEVAAECIAMTQILESESTCALAMLCRAVLALGGSSLNSIKKLVVILKLLTRQPAHTITDVLLFLMHGVLSHLLFLATEHSIM